jgi:hypothetical protein
LSAIQRAAAQGVLGTSQETFFPLLDLGDGQAVLAGCLLHRGFAPEDFNNESGAAFGGPSLCRFLLLIVHSQPPEKHSRIRLAVIAKLVFDHQRGRRWEQSQVPSMSIKTQHIVDVYGRT